MAKLSRSQLKKELRRNEIRDLLVYLNQAFTQRREGVILGVILGIIIIGGGYIYIGYQRSLNEEAVQLLADGSSGYQTQVMGWKAEDDSERSRLAYHRAVDSFTKLSSTASDEARSGHARIYLGNSHYYAGEYLKAIGEYDSYLREYPEGMFAGLARKNIALCRKANGQLREAAQELKALVEERPWGVSVPECLVNLAETYQLLGMKNEAIAAENQLVEIAEEEAYWRQISHSR